MRGSPEQLRLRFADDFDDYPKSINIRADESTSSGQPTKPCLEKRMVGRRAKRERRKHCRNTATAENRKPKAMSEAVDVEAAPVGLQHGKNDPKGFKTIADGFIPIEVFTMFGKLPLEMRREIFRQILPEPQTIHIFNNGYIQNIVTDNITKKTYIYRAAASYKVPRLAQVNRETRQEVMIYHRPSFAANFGGVPIYYNYKTDLLHFDSPETLLHFYGGSVPNHLPRSLTRGFRLNMREFHTSVSQLAIGNVCASEGMVGAVLNMMKGLKVILIEDNIMRPDGKKIIETFCHGEKELMMGWDQYTVVRSKENRIRLRYVDEKSFKERIQGWTGRIISEEEEAAEKAAKEEAKLVAEAAAQRERDKLNDQNMQDIEHGSKRKGEGSEHGEPISKKAKV